MNQPTHKSPFIAFNLALDIVRALRPLMEQLQKHDADLAKQLRRAASSVALNLAEGRRRIKRDRLHCWRIAAGSADEVRACLYTADAWGYLPTDSLETALDHIDQLLAICWRLTH